MKNRTHISSILLSGLLATAFAAPVFVALAPAFAQAELAPPTEVAVDAPITAVTLYRGRALVTRTAALPEGLGTFAVRITGLPPMIEPDSLSARVAGAKVLDVRFSETLLETDAATSTDIRGATKALDEARRTAARQEMQWRALDQQSDLLNAIAAKTAGESGKDFGSKNLDPAALAAQIKFIGQSREELINQRLALDAARIATNDQIKSLEAKLRALGGRTKTAREAVVTVGKSQAGAATLALGYLVTEAAWAPRYSVRATDAGDDALDLVTIELSAEIMQRTGEDWSNVALTLSTAQPDRRPEPPEVEPEFLAVAAPVVPLEKAGMPPTGVPGGPRGGSGGGYGFGDPRAAGVIGSADLGLERADVRDVLDGAYADAEGMGGAVVNYAIPRKVSIPSDDTRARSQRVASFDLKPEFTHVVHPIVDSTVYLRATARNTTGTQLVAGEARLFAGDDSVGSTGFPEVAPGGEITLWLGGDARYEARRMLVEKDTREQGVFGKDDVTVWKWRIDITSGAKGATRLEVVDRVPVSRDDKVRIELKDLSTPLSTDAAYLADDRPLGLLRWSFAMPGLASDGKPSTKSISWTVRQSAPSGTRIVPALE
jgi:uncharacterized protein (TIGR02231 family)